MMFAMDPNVYGLVLLYILAVAAGLLIQYAVIRFAVKHAILSARPAKLSLPPDLDT